MSEVMKIVLTAAATVVGGMLIFSLSQILQRLVLDPLFEQQKVIAEIDVALTLWAWAYANPAPVERPTKARRKAMNEFRSLASRLIAATNALRCRRVVRRLGAVGTEDAVKAMRCLIGISNSLYLPMGAAADTAGLGRHNSGAARDARARLGLEHGE